MKTLIIFTAFCFFVVSSSSMEYNITAILSKYPSFTNINGVLRDTGLAEEINRRDTITMLVMSDSSISDFIRSRSLDMGLIKKILCAHVILDYYDVERLTKLGILDRPYTLTTLFQASGSATGSQGFVNVSLIGEGEIAFGSAAPGGTLSSKLVNTVELHPSSLSILQITSPIWVPGIELAPPVFPPPPPPPPAPPVPSPAPEDSRAARRRSKAHAPAPAPAEAAAASNGSAPAPAKSGGSVAAAGVGVAAVAVLLASFLVAN